MLILSNILIEVIQPLLFLFFGGVAESTVKSLGINCYAVVFNKPFNELHNMEFG